MAGTSGLPTSRASNNVASSSRDSTIIIVTLELHKSSAVPSTTLGAISTTKPRRWPLLASHHVLPQVVSDVLIPNHARARSLNQNPTRTAGCHWELMEPTPRGDGHPQPPNWEECRHPLLCLCELSQERLVSLASTTRRARVLGPPIQDLLASSSRLQHHTISVNGPMVRRPITMQCTNKCGVNCQLASTKQRKAVNDHL